MNINQTSTTATAPTTAADYLTTKDDGFPKEENGRIYADAYDLIGTEKAKATLFHDIRGEKIFLCIATPTDIKEASNVKYNAERELSPEAANAAGIEKIKAEMETETGLTLELSAILKFELGL